MWFYHTVTSPKDVEGMANSVEGMANSVEGTANSVEGTANSVDPDPTVYTVCQNLFTRILRMNMFIFLTLSVPFLQKCDC